MKLSDKAQKEIKSWAALFCLISFAGMLICGITDNVRTTAFFVLGISFLVSLYIIFPKMGGGDSGIPPL